MIASLHNVLLNINNKTILDHVSFDIPQNKTTVFLGKNGSGKTSSLRCLNLLQKINSGTIKTLNSCPLPMLFQSPIIFEGNALYNFTFLQKIKKYESKLIWHDAFELSDIHQQNIASLSGGEKQKLFLSRVMSLDPNIIIMDEPNQNLDFQSEVKLKQLLFEEKKKNKTIILSLHDYNFAEEIADYLILLDQGKVILRGERDNFFHNLKVLRKSNPKIIKTCI